MSRISLRTLSETVKAVFLDGKFKGTLEDQGEGTTTPKERFKCFDYFANVFGYKPSHATALKWFKKFEEAN